MSMVKVSRLAPDSAQPLKNRLIEESHKDWAYFGFSKTNHSPLQFEWEIGKVRGFWELERGAVRVDAVPTDVHPPNFGIIA